MDSGIEEEFLRPAKRRRISQQGLHDVLSGHLYDDSGRLHANYDLQSRSLPLVSSKAPGEMRHTSVSTENGEELDIVGTSDNEEILLGEDEDYATTLFARTSPRPTSSIPSSPPYHGSRLSTLSEAENGEVDPLSRDVSPAAPSPTIDALESHVRVVEPPPRSLSSQIPPPSSMHLTSPKPPSLDSKAGENTFTISKHVATASISSSVPMSTTELNREYASETESDDWSDNGHKPSFAKSASVHSPFRISRLPSSGLTTLPFSIGVEPFNLLPSIPTENTIQNTLNGSKPLSHRQLSPSRLTASLDLSPSFPKSPSLTPPPPSPPRRRTRESNKKFAPYTAYRQQYGDAAITELRRLEQVEAGRRLHGQRSTVVNPDEDDTWAASQSQMDDESQDQTQASIIPPIRPLHGKPIHKPRGLTSRSTLQSRPSVPVPIWESRRPNISHTLHEPIPLKPRDPNAPRKFVDPDGSPVHVGGKQSFRPVGALKEPKSRPKEVAAQATGPFNENDALLQLYADESDEEEQELGMDSHVAEPFLEGFDDQVEPSGDGAPTTDPDTNDSDMDLEPIGPTRKRPSSLRSVETSDHSGSGSPDVSDEGSEDREIRKRKRILARVMPAVMIKKSAQEEREKELERQRKRRDIERARREGLGLGDSDPDEDEEDTNILPGQSKTRRILDLDSSMWNSQIGDGEVIDLTSDRESLDHDDPIVLEAPFVEIDSDDDDDSDLMELEAMEDNAFPGGTRNRGHHGASLAPRRKGPINRRNPNLRQSRIDRMLNSTTGTRPRSKQSNNHKVPRGLTTNRRPSSSKQHPLNTYIFPRMSSGEVQTRLPFEPIYQGQVPPQGSRKKGDQRSKKRIGLPRSNTATSVLSGFTDLFDVLAPLNPAPRTKAVKPRTAVLTHTHNTQGGRSLPRSRINHRIVDDPALSLSSLPSHDDNGDPDAKIEISLNSALAFGIRRNRLGFSLSPSSWLAQGKLLDLVRVLCGTSEPARPLPCSVSTIRFDSTTSILDLQLQFPTVCDLIFASVETPSTEEYRVATQHLMRFICLYVSWSSQEPQEGTMQMLNYVADQVRALMDRVKEFTIINRKTGRDFDMNLLSIHWFTVEISNRIAKTTTCIKRMDENDMIILSDPATDRYTISLMTRLLELGVRRSLAALQSPDDESVEKYAAELWIALIHVTVLQPITSEDSKAGSNVFWRLISQSFDQCSRQFASVAHETEFLFATMFSLSSLSSFDALGVGQETRVLHGYWPLVCRALNNIEMSPVTDRTKRISQSTLAAKDTYIGMLFARCNVLAFKWGWSLQDPQESKQLFEVLRGALKDRRFVNLLHEQSDFPYFITRRNLLLLHQFEPKDSIQTIVIKLMLRKVRESGEEIKSAKKWISLLAFTSALEFTKDRPPTQKELSALFNQFTIKFVLLYVNPDPGNARAIIQSSKKIVNFQNADHRSRLVCIRSAMVFGRFYRHFRLPLDEVVQWMADMGLSLLEEHKTLGMKVTPHLKKETGTLCALLLGSLRDVLRTDLLEDIENDRTLATPFHPGNSIEMLGFVAKLIPLTRDWEASLAEECARLLMTIFQLRTTVFPTPRLPLFPAAVIEEESQEDYGFDPIDLDDPMFTDVLNTHEGGAGDAESWTADSKLAVAISEFINPVALLIARLGHAEPNERKKANVELWVQCWARMGAICQAHNIRSWDYFLHRGPDTLGRVADVAWQQQTEPLFLLEILRSDMRVYATDKERFIRGWFVTMAADPDHIIPAYTYTLFRVDGFKHFLFESVMFQRDMAEDDYDETAFVNSRLTILNAVFANLNHSLLSRTNNPEIVKRNVEAVDAVSETLKVMRHNISNASGNPGDLFREYAAFCQDITTSLRSSTMADDTRIAPLLQDPWVTALKHYVSPE